VRLVAGDSSGALRARVVSCVGCCIELGTVCIATARCLGKVR